MRYIAVMLMLAALGCEEGPSYPREIEGQCKQALAEARECIRGVNPAPQRPGWPTVTLVKGERKISGMWCWRSPEWRGAWVGGLFEAHGGGYRIRIGHNPATRAEINYAALRHEMGHYVLAASFGDWGHDRRYSSCFWLWSGPSTASRGGKPRPVEIVSDNNIVTLFYDDEINRLESLGLPVE